MITVARLDANGDTSALEDPVTTSWANLVMTMSCEKSRCARSVSLLANAAIRAVRHRREGLTNGPISAAGLPSQPVNGPTFGRSPCAQTFALDSSPCSFHSA